MTKAAGVDARQREGFWTVHLTDGSLDRIEHLESLEAVIDQIKDVDVLAVDIPIGHEDPDGTQGDGRRACERAARDRMGPAADERILPMPPPAVYNVDHYHQALALCEENGWPKLAKPIWHGQKRVQALTEASETTDGLVEMHPELSFTVMHELHGGEGPLEHYGRGWAALYERLELLHEAGLRPSRSMGGVGRASPKDVIDATAAAWSALRVARGQAVVFPKRPPKDPRTGRDVAFYA